MARTRSIIVAMLAVSVLAVGCGGDESAEEGPQTTGQEVATSDGDQPDSGTAERADLDSDATPTTAPAPLGERFPWCGELQSVLDRQAQAQAQSDAAWAAYGAASDAWEAAFGDELDEAEAWAALDEAGLVVEDAWVALSAANGEAVVLLKPGYAPSPDTLAIALERARSEHRLNADPAVLELHELAYSPSGSASAEPAAEEPEAIEMAADPQTADPQPRNLEETLAAVAVIQSEIDGLAQSVRDAVWEAEQALASLQTAADARSAMDAHGRLIDALSRADEVTRQLHVVDGTLRQQVAAPYHAHAEAALAAGQITADDHEAALVTIQDALGALAMSALSSGADTRQGRQLAQTALEETADTLILADASGMAAFRTSLGESCEQ